MCSDAGPGLSGNTIPLPPWDWISPARNQKAAEELAGTVSHQQSRQIEQVMTEVRKDDHKVELAEKTKKTIESILTDLDVGYKVRLPGADGVCVGGWVGLVG